MDRDRAPLTPEQVAYYRRVLESHRTDPASGTCVVCGVARCQHWCNAFDRLAFAGHPMAEPDKRWSVPGSAR